MNATIFWRIVWKEYRAQRAFWIAMAVLIVLVDLIVQANYSAGLMSLAKERIECLFCVSFGLAGLYAVATGAMLFAGEKESETYEFLRGLPVKAATVFAGKVAFALVSASALSLVSLAVFRLLAGHLPNLNSETQFEALCAPGANTIILIALGVLFSLLLRRGLLALIFGLTAYMLSADLSPRFGLPMMAIVIVADVVLGLRWFKERMFSPTKRCAKARQSVSKLPIHFAPAATTMFARLLWQEIRQSISISTGLIVMFLTPVLILSTLGLFHFGPEYDRGYLALLPPATILAGPLLGATVFLADQTGARFRYLSERGIAPRLVWLSRQARGLAVLLIGMTLLAVLAVIITAFSLWLDHRLLTPASVLEYTEISAKRIENLATSISIITGFAIASYSCGQLCSMVFRSGTNAATLGTVLTGLVCTWAGIMYLLGMSWLWTVAPLVLGFFLATYMHTPNWLAERYTWRAWLRLAVPIAVPALAIMTAIPFVRIYEIPWVDPTVSVPELTQTVSAEDAETMSLYTQAFRNLMLIEPPRDGDVDIAALFADESKRTEVEKQVVPLAEKATRRPLLNFYFEPEPNSRPSSPAFYKLRDLCQLFLKRAVRLQSDGKLDDALDSYMVAARIAANLRAVSFGESVQFGEGYELCKGLWKWSACNGQSSKRILRCLKTVEKLWRRPRPSISSLENLYLTGFMQDAFCFAQVSGWGYLRWLPWERARALRVANYLLVEQRKINYWYEKPLESDGKIDAEVAWKLQDRIPSAWLRDATCRSVCDQFVEDYNDDRIILETYRRATRLILALEAWKLDHGKLPPTLDDLKGKYLDVVPINPYYGQPFVYVPNGLSDTLGWSARGDDQLTLVKPGQPFIGCSSSARESATGPQFLQPDVTDSLSDGPVLFHWINARVFLIP